ncbi:alpha-soluble NSF attachment protein, putative [Trichomonas vaginalis G3]|uniref:Alpha-soluble NSF attachment protein, putative n=1 Tax=Trichomonas vaginalis (strain ATCC PRA-98 / G3) TaxID=412133 RepID=A2G7B4_TRIV3|nr:SNARE complex disassembly protein family [Trichomonas vaginalis G3]EAX86953.1 alpha-soluble NSF attachment protein, putative [Trichomonas vaginalis G3]KAI5501649.1 SNARE complex disassembly protein family [Trichomonas vaginalis G3]|eukprot:XP_001299883.1 alpha-soluble NSF attachment protein [Trichomonas vaginalis G3]
MEDRAKEYIKEAQKKLNKFFSTEASKNEQAAPLFNLAGNSFKAARLFQEAGEAYEKSAECYERARDVSSSTNELQNAAKAYAKAQNFSKAIDMFIRAANFYRESNKTSQAAKLLVEASKVFLEDENQDQAVQVLEEAVQIYEDENQPSSACQHITTIADIKSGQKNYVDASKLYRKVAEIRLADRLTQLAATEYMEKATLCQLAAGDLIGAEKMCDEFVNAAPQFDSTREYKLLKALFEAFRNHDNQARATAVAEYDSIKRLDKWHIEVHTDIMNIIQGNTGDEEEENGLL